MTDRLTDEQLFAIEGRAAGLYEYATGLDAAWQAEADELAGTDVPALLTEVRALRTERAELIQQRDGIADATAKALGHLVPRDEVLAEVVAWLTKKAGEHRAKGRKQDGIVADAITTLASKVHRGAVRANNLLGADLTTLDPIPLRWGLDDVMWGDDDTVTVMLSGPDRAPYWLELDPERAAALRVLLAGPPPADRTELRDRIADIRERHAVLKARDWDAKPHQHSSDGCRCLSCADEPTGWVMDHPHALDCNELVEQTPNGFSRKRGSCEFGPLLSFPEAAALAHAADDLEFLLDLAVLPADTGQAALIEELRTEITKLIWWRDEDQANAAKREAELRADNKALRAAVKCLRGDRAAVLREAADFINGLDQDFELDPGRGDAAAHLRCMADDAQPAEVPLVHVGWWCWSGNGHLTATACRSDNVPLHVPAEWADGMAEAIQRISDETDEEERP